MNEVETLLAARIERGGPIPFDEVVGAALYAPVHGFYEAGGRAGRRGDFVTSAEVGPLFGAVVARALDGWWDDLGRPDPFVVVEAGAGPGTLARSVLHAQPACGPALRYVMVERSASQRARHGQHLTLTPPAFGLGPSVLDADGIGQPAAPGEGPVVVSLPELPAVEGPVVVLANELLDNVPFRLLQRAAERWDEVRVGLDVTGQGLVEVLVPADDELARLGGAFAPGAPVGARIPVQSAAAAWLRSALDLAAPGGRLVIFDYATTTPLLAHRPVGDWLRTYAGHERGGAALERLGAQDVTVEVCTDQLARVRRPVSDRPQADWLRAHGLDDLVDEGKRVWAERAHLGDLQAIRARSRVSEAEALCDPAGLGAFRVLEWTA